MFAPFVYPAANPESIVNANLVMAGLKSGWQIDVIMQNPDNWYPINEYASEFIPVSKVIHRVESPKDIVKDIYFRLCSKKNHWNLHPLFGDPWSAPALKMGRALAQKNKYDVIISRVLPDYAHLPALNLSREFGIPWIANWNDPTPWHISPPPYGSGPEIQPPGFPAIGRLRRNCLIKFYKSISDMASWQTFPCERLRNYMKPMLGLHFLNKSSVIPHIMIGKNSSKRLREKVSRSQEFTLCHAGSLRPPRSPDVFLRGVRRFIDTVKPKKPPVIKFLGERVENVKDTVCRMNLKQYARILKALSYEATLQLLAEETVLVIIEAPLKEGIFMPSKFVDYVSTRRPILAISPVEGTIADYLQRHGGGVATDATSEDDVARGIALLYSAWEKNTLDDRYLSSELYKEFEEDKIINQYNLLFYDLKYNKERMS